MAGNACEWQANHVDLKAKSLGTFGGAWSFSGSLTRVSIRHSSSPVARENFIGFRVVVLPRE
jgi:formylglycine-generating enzyme required for sulfatase activity